MANDDVRKKAAWKTAKDERPYYCYSDPRVSITSSPRPHTINQTTLLLRVRVGNTSVKGKGAEEENKWINIVLVNCK